MRISVQREDFDAGAEARALSRDPKIGAVASFVGVVREVPMTLEHYAGMTEREIGKIVEEAKSRWRVMDCTVIHRYGDLSPTDQIVLVVVASAHRGDAFDPYPYVFLNLFLSMLAALQAPVILMSQNRQAERDRLESNHDYETDLKAEIEIASLHDKVDHLLHAQWERMVELQEMQMELLTELTRRTHR